MVEENSRTLMAMFMMVISLKVMLKGEWQNDKAQGYGTYYHKNGAKYEGYWKDDL